MKKIWLLTSLFALSCPAVAVAAQPPTEQKVVLNIAAQPVGDALNALAAQTGLQVVLYSDDMAGLRSPAISGQFTPQEALQKILANTALEAQFLDARTVAIRPARGHGRKSSRATPAEQMRLASSQEVQKGRPAGRSDSETADVIVEGERHTSKPFSTANLDLTRTADDVLPFQVFDARDIELSGAANLQEFLQMRLPQNFTSEVFDEAYSPAVAGQLGLTGQVSMRGWDVQETVFLLNGRRMPAHYQTSSSHTENATPDLRGIPLGSIERIEILSSAGSAIYGSNATGGVINIITRRDFKGGQVSVNYESPADTHAPRRTVSVSYGLPIRWGLGLRLAASYSDTEPLHAGDRANVTVLRWRRLALERDPTRLLTYVSDNPYATSSTPWIGATPNIRAASTSDDLFPEMPGLQNFTTVPIGSTGSIPLSGYQPGVWNMDLAEGSDGANLEARNSTLGIKSSYTTVSLGIDKMLNERWRWSLDLNGTKNNREGTETSRRNFSSSSGLVNDVAAPFIPAAAPTNPFGTAVRVHMVDPNLGRPELRLHPRSVSWDVSSVLLGEIGQWRGFIDVSYSHNENRAGRRLFHEPYGGWTAAFMSGTYNPFVDPRVVSPAAPDFYENYIAYYAQWESATRTYQSSVKASGPLFRLPAGSMQLTMGLDGRRVHRYRQHEVRRFEDGLTGETRIPEGAASAEERDSNPAYGRFRFDSYAAYVETIVPLLAESQGLYLIKGLELFASGRMDQTIRNAFRLQSVMDEQSGIPPKPLLYTDTTRVFSYGVRYEAIEGLMLRASQSIGFKPPSFGTLTPAEQPPARDLDPLYDPVRDEYVTILRTMYVIGGNPDLRPETTDSVNIGIIFSPPWLGGTRVSLDYLQSIRNDAIASVGTGAAQWAIDMEREKSGLVYRDAPDGHSSGVGPISFLDLRYTNLSKIMSKSIDLTLTQVLNDAFGGRLTLTAAVTRNISFKMQSSGTAPVAEQVRNVNSLLSRQIEWNGNAQLHWERANWGIGWSARYFDYLLVRPQYVVLQGGDRAPWALNHDLTINYRALNSGRTGSMMSMLAGSSITLGVKNVFNREPRFWAEATQRGVAPFDSIMGRSIWLSLRRDFGT